MKILVLDNYDSFVYNLVQYIGEQGADPIVFRNDLKDLEGIRTASPDGIVISPGPGRPDIPRDMGICLDVIKELGKETPILGVCLGHQAIVHAFGGKIIQAKQIMHGKTSLINHDGTGLFHEVKSPLTVMRYHSLIADEETFPLDRLDIISRTEDDEIFAVEHKEYPIFGVQFHPESIGTEQGKLVIKNFLGFCND